MYTLRCKDCFTEQTLHFAEMNKLFKDGKKKLKRKSDNNPAIPCPSTCRVGAVMSIVKIT